MRTQNFQQNEMAAINKMKVVAFAVDVVIKVIRAWICKYSQKSCCEVSVIIPVSDLLSAKMVI